MTLTQSQKQGALYLWRQGKNTYDIASALGGKNARISEAMVWDFITAHICDKAMTKHLAEKRESA